MCNFKQIIYLLVIILPSLTYSNSFEKNCLNCHFQEAQLERFIYKYTLKYSSQKRIENAIFEYLKYPTREKSVMPSGFLNRFGIKEKTILNDDELKKSIHKYYKRYNIKQFIK